MKGQLRDTVASDGTRNVGVGHEGDTRDPGWVTVRRQLGRSKNYGANVKRPWRLKEGIEVNRGSSLEAS